MFAFLGKAHLPSPGWQTCRVSKSPRQTLSDNLRWLMANTRFDTQAKLGGLAAIDQRTIGRFLNMEHAPTLDKLGDMARGLGLEAWQMLAPKFGADLYEIDAERRIVPVRIPVADRKASFTAKAKPLDLAEAAAVLSPSAAQQAPKRTAGAEGLAAPSMSRARAPKT